WQFDKHDVAELILRVIRDAESRDRAFDANPFMVLGESDLAHAFSSCLTLPASALVTVSHEGQPRDHARDALVAHRDRDHGAGIREACGNIAHGDRHPETRAEPARGDRSDHGLLVVADPRTVPHRHPPLRGEPDAPAIDALLQLLCNPTRADEIE